MERDEKRTEHELLHRRQHVQAERDLILIPLQLQPADDRPVVEV